MMIPPSVVFMGDALFIGDAGRTDLNEDPVAGADTLYDSVHSGVRAIIAASILQRNGYERMEYFLGSFQAWTTRALPVEEWKQAVET